MGLAKRWTFYIGKDGKVLFIDKDVKVDTAGADIAAKLAELGVDTRPPGSRRASQQAAFLFPQVHANMFDGGLHSLAPWARVTTVGPSCHDPGRRAA